MSANCKRTPGEEFRYLLTVERPVQVVGAISAYAALLAESVGFRCLYLSGGGVAASSYGMPDLGIITLDDVLADARRITSVSGLPLLVDIDTGWGGAFNIIRTVREMERAGAAAVHIEDQVAQKRCGHRPNKKIVPIEEMCHRINAAVTAKRDDKFVIMARTDALAVEGFESVLTRVREFQNAGADAIFAEAMTSLDMYARIKDIIDIPLLANITEFGETPMYTTQELISVGVDMVLYPLSAFRAMSRAALEVYNQIRTCGTQKDMIDRMQTRDELYRVLGYDKFEQQLDKLFQEG